MNTETPPIPPVTFTFCVDGKIIDDCTIADQGKRLRGLKIKEFLRVAHRVMTKGWKGAGEGFAQCVYCGNRVQLDERHPSFQMEDYRTLVWKIPCECIPL